MTTAARLLKQRTSILHVRVEKRLELMDPGLSAIRLRQIIERFYGFWRPVERGIDLWALNHRDSASRIDWYRRRRSDIFAADLIALGKPLPDHNSIPQAHTTFEHLEYAQVLGWLYVAEGSTLGGAMIQRHLVSLPEVAALGLRSFMPYEEGPAGMWKKYRAGLQEFTVGNASRTASVIEAAVTTFSELDQWLIASDRRAG
jgi:heme oxygenase (biliverdin-IX-beta and delta-forming)